MGHEKAERVLEVRHANVDLHDIGEAVIRSIGLYPCKLLALCRPDAGRNRGALDTLCSLVQQNSCKCWRRASTHLFGEQEFSTFFAAQLCLNFSKSHCPCSWSSLAVISSFSFVETSRSFDWFSDLHCSYTQSTCSSNVNGLKKIQDCKLHAQKFSILALTNTKEDYASLTCALILLACSRCSCCSVFWEVAAKILGSRLGNGRSLKEHRSRG